MSAFNYNLTIVLGSSNTGLAAALRLQAYNNVAAPVGGVVSTGFHESATPGTYIWSGPLDDTTASVTVTESGIGFSQSTAVTPPSGGGGRPFSEAEFIRLNPDQSGSFIPAEQSVGPTAYEYANGG